MGLFKKEKKEEVAKQEEIKVAPTPVQEIEDMPEQETSEETEDKEETASVEISTEEVIEILKNQEQRLQNLEAALFRIKGAI
jgi:hypothetical protein